MGETLQRNLIFELPVSDQRLFWGFQEINYSNVVFDNWPVFVRSCLLFVRLSVEHDHLSAPGLLRGATRGGAGEKPTP